MSKTRIVGNSSVRVDGLAKVTGAAQYVDDDGLPSMDVRFNPNGSLAALEALTSPDGRILGKMGHSERIGAGLYKNVPGEYDMRLFESMVRYFA